MSALAAVPMLAAADENWINLFDGHSLDGWRPSENKGSWTVADGALAANGPRSHLFYTGPVRSADFRNFELEVEVKTQPECNSGVYFHTAYQETGFPEKGFEIQINNTARGDHGYLERKKTGSLYGIRNQYKQLVSDNQWFKINVAVKGKNVQIRLNGVLLVDYVEPTPPVIPEGGEHGRFLDHGTFALQCHNDGSRALFRSVRVRPLPDNLPAYLGRAPVVDNVYREIINIGRHNLPMVDYHVYLKNGLTLESALAKSRRDGIEYGITSDIASSSFAQNLNGKPVFIALRIDGAEERRALSRQIARQFDYIMADATVITDSHGKRVRLSVPEEASTIHNPEELVDALVKQTVEMLQKQPIDFFASPTYLPASLANNHAQLWTEERMKKIIDAAAQNQVAIEINNRYRLPSPAFIRMAKEAKCKFGFGSGNAGAADLGRCEYGLQMVRECNLDWQNFFVPGSWTAKAADRKSDAFQS